MKNRKNKFTTMLAATLFAATLIWFAPVVARAQIILKPGEIIYSRTFTPGGPDCTSTTVWAVGQDGSNDRLLFANASHPRISPDGRFIMFNRGSFDGFCQPFSTAQVWVRELATGRESLITTADNQSFSTFFTPETNRADNQIIFDSAGTVCRINMDGTNRLCSTIGFNGSIDFTYPNVRGGDFLGVAASRNGAGQGLDGFYTFNYNLTNAVKIPNTNRLDRSPSWSNNGQTIAYGVTSLNRNNPYFFGDLFKINPDGSNKTRLTFTNTPEFINEGFTHSLVWTNNSTGDEFIFNAARINGVAGIYRISADGSGNMTRIPTTAGNAPDWVGGIVPVYSPQQVVSFGGGATTGGQYTLVDTIGQAFAGQTSSGGSYNLQSGFWAGVIGSARTPFDFDGDAKADVSVFRPSNGVWYLLNSQIGLSSVFFGIPTDLIAPADFDGDGKTDVAVFRDGNWYILQSSNGAFLSVPFGVAGDLPRPADFDGDGKADVNVFRPSNGSWFRLNSSNGQFAAVQFGANGDAPIVGDFDGDGKADVTVYRPANGVWYSINSGSGAISAVQFGAAGDVTNAADFDGDGKTDIAVFRPSNGNWFLQQSTAGFAAIQFGANGDIPAAGDFDGDGKADVSVFRPSTGAWFRLNSANGSFYAVQFGANGDKPIPAAFVQ